MNLFLTIVYSGNPTFSLHHQRSYDMEKFISYKSKSFIIILFISRQEISRYQAAPTQTHLPDLIEGKDISYYQGIKLPPHKPTCQT